MPNKFAKILVTLDNSEMDVRLIESASFISKLNQSSEVQFMNVIQNANVPDQILKEFPNLMDDAIEERKEKIRLNIDQYFANNNTTIKLVIKHGQATKCILKHSANENIDLIILGRKNEKKGGGIIINRVARRAACSLLIIPKEFTRPIDNILVPIDFSDHSLESMNLIIDKCSKYLPKVKITSQNVYQVPSGYHSTGKTYQEFAAVMEENATKQYAHFSKKFHKNNLDISSLFTLDRHEDVISTIKTTANAMKASVIVVGAKGLSSTAALFLGSSAEKLIQMDLRIPLFVFRAKGKQKGIVDYLMNI